MDFQRRGCAFSNTLRFSKLVTLTIVDVLCVVYCVFLSPARVRREDRRVV